MGNTGAREKVEDTGAPAVPVKGMVGKGVSAPGSQQQASQQQSSEAVRGSELSKGKSLLAAAAGTRGVATAGTDLSGGNGHGEALDGHEHSMPMSIPSAHRHNDPSPSDEPGLSIFGSPLMSPLGGSPFPPLTEVAVSCPARIVYSQKTATKELHPTTISWTRTKAKSLKISGSFNQWQDPIDMQKNADGTFSVTLNLCPGIHEFKFLVDGTWQHDPDMRTLPSTTMGSVNNLLIVGAFGGGVANAQQTMSTSAMSEMTSADALPLRPVESVSSLSEVVDDFEAFRSDTPPGEYGQVKPNLVDVKAPPTLPPHLLQVTLNSAPYENDPTQLPEPNHVMLNHLYALSIKDHVMVLGTTHRYKKKFVTTVLYKPVDI